MWDMPKTIGNLKTLKPMVSATPAHPKGKRCSRKMHFLLNTQQGFSPKPEFKLTTPHGDLENSHYSFSVSQLGVIAFGTGQILGAGLSLVVNQVLKASSIPALPSLWYQQNAWTQFLIENHHWYFDWRPNYYLVGLIHPASLFWLVYLMLNKTVIIIIITKRESTFEKTRISLKNLNV